MFVTGDDNLSFQQHVAAFDLAVGVFRPTSKALPHLLELMPEFRRRSRDLRADEVIRLYPPSGGGRGMTER